VEAETDGTRRSTASLSRAAVILGNDALLAARPCTPAQLASACVLAGFDIIVPPSTGDEIVAAAYLDRLAGRSDPAVIACACPCVRAIVSERSRPDGIPCIAVAAPPVAAARYIRAEHGDDVLITFVGDCPGAADPAIDARFTPAGFLASLHRQGIAIDEQPELDRHRIGWARHLSTTGGLPARRFVAKPPVDRVVREVTIESIDTDMPSVRAPVVLDVVDAGCACSMRHEDALALEPARSPVPLFAVPPALDVGADASPPRSRASLRARHGLTSESSPPVVATTRPPGVEAASPPIIAREPAPPAPVVTREPPKPAVPVPPGVNRPAHARPRAEPVRAVRRSPLLIILPLVVLAGAAALGVAAYATGSGGRRTPAPSVDPAIAARADSAESTRSADSATGGRDSITVLASPAASDADSARAAGARADSIGGSTDSLPRRRVRRPRAPEVMPGWLPQGQPTWTPDTLAARRRDTLPAPPPNRRPPA
jgi:hypothetical protein